MNRADAIQRVASASEGTLTIRDVGDGWPSLGTVSRSGEAVPAAIYAGVLVSSHRGRDLEERRFQNPGQNRPIRIWPDCLTVLFGIWMTESNDDIVVVGFDPRRRMGRLTRQSLFAPAHLIEKAAREGWCTHRSSSGEIIVAFRPDQVERYGVFRVQTLLGEVAMTDEVTLREEIAKRLPEDLSLLASSIWSQLRVSGSVPQSHQDLLGAVFEDARFLGGEPSGSLDEIARRIVNVCEPDTGDDEWEVYFQGGAPTQFFYETVASHLARLEIAGKDDELDTIDDEQSEGEDDDKDEEVDFGRIDASVRTISVRHLFDLVHGKRLDITPPWQRQDVWSVKRKRELIRSLIVGIPLPSIILHRRNSRYFVIDGKQRLTSIVQFLRNEFKSPKFVSTDERLIGASNAFYNHPDVRKRSLIDEVRDSLELMEVPVLEFRDVAEGTLRKIFHLYNVSGLKLNAAEIRNAVYQENALHQVVYVLAGEGHGTTDLGVGGIEIQQRFARRLRTIFPGAGKRYQGVDLLGRYLGYSRAVNRTPGVFTPPSTSKAIDNFFDLVSSREDPKQVAREIIQAFDDAERFFDVSDERLAFYLRDENGRRKFNKLLTTTHLVAARFLREAIKAGAATEKAAEEAAEQVLVVYPQNQQRDTIWNHQASLLLGVRDALGLAVDRLGSWWVEFFNRMESCRSGTAEPA